VEGVYWGDGRFFTLMETLIPSTPITTIFLPSPSCRVLQLTMVHSEDRRVRNTSLKPISLANLITTLTATHSFIKEEELKGLRTISWKMWIEKRKSRENRMEALLQSIVTTIKYDWNNKIRMNKTQ